jgi:hypothetical protein
MLAPGGFHYFNYNQKLFELGDPAAGTLGIVTWGLSGLGETSYRTLFAHLSDDIRKRPPKNVAEVAGRWIDKFWVEYLPTVKPCQDLNGKKTFDPIANPLDPEMRTKDEEAWLEQLKRGLFVGFCIGGYVLENRKPEAFVTLFDPLLGKPVPMKLPMAWAFWGAPNSGNGSTGTITGMTWEKSSLRMCFMRMCSGH